mgnify:CR=1 FL=1
MSEPVGASLGHGLGLRPEGNSSAKYGYTPCGASQDLLYWEWWLLSTTRNPQWCTRSGGHELIQLSNTILPFIPNAPRSACVSSFNYLVASLT